MRTNSPLDDSINTVMDDEAPSPKVEPNDWERLGRSGKYKSVNAYLESRKDYHRRFLPGGIPAEEVTEKERVAHWASACIIIKEIEMIQAQVANQTRRNAA